MAITLGAFTQSPAGFTGTLKTLNITAALTIVPVDKTSDNGPDYRVYAGQPTRSAPAGARSPNRAARPTSTSNWPPPNLA
jgi:uncharacterized protein (DUF736 family)